MERAFDDCDESGFECHLHYRIASQLMVGSKNIGPTIRSSHGLLSQVGKDTYTELFDLYLPLYNAIANKENVWLGLNLIFPSTSDLQLPLINSIKCYIMTFHGDPIDHEWVMSSISRIRKFKGESFFDNLILCSNGDRPSYLPADVKYYQIEHLHLLPRLFGEAKNHLSRKAEVRHHKFSLLSHRAVWFRTALFMCLYKLDGVFSFTQQPDFKDERLLSFLRRNDMIHTIDDFMQYLPMPLDNYYENPGDLNNAWSVNNIAYQDCLMNVVNESSIPYKGHMSEKSFKPFISKTLPIFNSKKQIQRLREFGFLIDDSIYEDNNDPILYQVNTIKKLLTWSKNQLIDLVNQHSTHNREWFFTDFNEEVSRQNLGTMQRLIADVKNIVD